MRTTALRDLGNVLGGPRQKSHVEGRDDPEGILGSKAMEIAGRARAGALESGNADFDQAT
jgi:hypothetical protein